LKKIFDKTTGITDGTSILKIVENEKWNKANIMTKRLLFWHPYKSNYRCDSSSAAIVIGKG